MNPPVDVLGNSGAERAVDLRGLNWFNRSADDAPARDLRISSPVSVALRRAVARVRSEKDFSSASDIVSTEAVRVLDDVTEAVRYAIAHGRSCPISASPIALTAVNRLRQAFIEEIDRLRTSLRSGQLPEAMRAFDLVREEMDRDETTRFVAALCSNDALDLVVEIAHDMRSPLTAILMLTGMIRRNNGAPLVGIPSQQLALVYNAAFGLNALINDVIALARGGDRLLDRECVPFSIHALIDSVADIVRPIAEERKLALTMPAPSTDARLGQPVALSRVLLNLVSNALKFTETGGVAIGASKLSPTVVRFEVTDSGPGIAPETLSTVFEPFGRSTNGRGRRFSKTGLGLGICRKLVRDMGGELRVDSVLGKGTRFYFDLTLPLADEAGLPRRAIGAML
jgi:signal transduction histidine kinase